VSPASCGREGRGPRQGWGQASQPPLRRASVASICHNAAGADPTQTPRTCHAIKNSKNLDLDSDASSLPRGCSCMTSPLMSLLEARFNQTGPWAIQRGGASYPKQPRGRGAPIFLVYFASKRSAREVKYAEGPLPRGNQVQASSQRPWPKGSGMGQRHVCNRCWSFLIVTNP